MAAAGPVAAFPATSNVSATFPSCCAAPKTLASKTACCEEACGIESNEQFTQVAPERAIVPRPGRAHQRRQLLCGEQRVGIAHGAVEGRAIVGRHVWGLLARLVEGELIPTLQCIVEGERGARSMS
jgi:hypothetical protein